MKKYLVLLMVLPLFLCSCDSEKKGAIDYLQSRMKSPSSFKAVKVECDEIDAYQTADTLYHVARIFGTRYEYIDAWKNVDSIYVDQIQITITSYPARKAYWISYDAANSYGAIMREFETINFCNGGYYTTEEYIALGVEDKHDPILFNKVLKTQSSFSENVGDWVNDYDVFGMKTID